MLAQLLRTVARGVNVLSRSSRMRFYDDYEAALPAVAPHVTAPLSAASVAPALREVVLAVRAEFIRVRKPTRHSVG
jgi:hypothetical protein